MNNPNVYVTRGANAAFQAIQSEVDRCARKTNATGRFTAKAQAVCDGRNRKRPTWKVLSYDIDPTGSCDVIVDLLEEGEFGGEVG